VLRAATVGAADGDGALLEGLAQALENPVAKLEQLVEKLRRSRSVR
jgi:hypothetical protein